MITAGSSGRGVAYGLALWYLSGVRYTAVMPQKDMSSKLGKSSSPIVNRVIQNSKNVQQPLPCNTATKEAFNKKPIKP
jgi:hypothetical protein